MEYQGRRYCLPAWSNTGLCRDVGFRAPWGHFSSSPALPVGREAASVWRRKAPRRHRPAWAWRLGLGGGGSRPGWGRRRTGGRRRPRPPAPCGGGRWRGAGSAAGAGERPGRGSRRANPALPALSVPCALPRPAALYCMNEAELLEVALAVLAEVSRDLWGWGRQGSGGRVGSAAARGSLAALSGRAGGRCQCRMALPASLLCPSGPAAFAKQNRGPGAWRGVAHGHGGLPSRSLGAPGVKSCTAGTCCFPCGQNLQSEEDEEKARSGSEEEQEIPPTPSEVPGSTASADGGSDRGPALPSPPAAGAEAEGTAGENSEDDVLKYVRQIFFS